MSIPILPREVMSKEIDIRGIFVPLSSSEDLSEAHEYLYDALERGALNPVVAQEYDLTKAPESHEKV